MQHTLKGPFTVGVITEDNKKLLIKYYNPDGSESISLELQPHEAKQIAVKMIILAEAIQNLSNFRKHLNRFDGGEITNHDNCTS